MPALTLANLVLYAAQAALLVGALALTLAALRPSPGFRLAACRTALVLLLALPFQGLVRPSAPEPRPQSTVAGGPARAIDAADVRGEAQAPWGSIVAAVVGTGIVLRLLWLGFGLVRLSSLARRLSAAAATDEIGALQAELGTRADVHFVPGVEQPVTFGLAPAKVLLPMSLLEAPAERRRAVLCHELLHVRRGDWVWVLAEEFTLSVLWFHPAVWWLVGELQLAREQVVDQLTVAATGARRTYMDALFSAADAPSAPPLFAQFLRRRHLARRLVSLAEEVVMSRARLAVGGVLMLGMLAGSGAVGLAAWPLAVVQAPAQGHVMRFHAAAASIAVSRVDMEFPDGLSREMTHGMALFDVIVDANGAVSSVRLAKVGAQNEKSGVTTSDLRALESAMANAAADPGSGGPVFADGAAVIRDLETLAKAAAAALQQWRFVPPQATPAIARVSVVFDLTYGRATFGPAEPLSGFPAPPTSTFASAPPPPPRADGTLRVGGNIRAPQKIVNVPPVYPAEAMEAKVQGVVIIETKIDAEGHVAEAWVLRSIPMLDEAALQAVKQWRYSPTLMNGVPVPVLMTVTVNFTLSD